MTLLIEWSYIVASILFILGLKLLGKQATARRGNLLSAVGMLIAIVATLLVSGLHYQWIIIGSVIGSAIGAVAAQRVRMTAMPEMVALFNGFGGLASLLWAGRISPTHPGIGALSRSSPSSLACLIGGVTFTGSVVAYRQAGRRRSRRGPSSSRGSNRSTRLSPGCLGCGVIFGCNPDHFPVCSFDRRCLSLRLRRARRHPHRRRRHAGGHLAAEQLTRAWPPAPPGSSFQQQSSSWPAPWSGPAASFSPRSCARR